MKINWQNLSLNNPRTLPTLLGGMLVGGCIGGLLVEGDRLHDGGTLYGLLVGAVVAVVMLLCDNTEW